MTALRAPSRLVLLGASIVATGCSPRPAAPPPRTPVAPRPVQPAVLDVPEAATGARALQSKVTRVTVYADRARITRAASASATAEPTVYAFRGLPGWVDDGSVRVAVNSGRIVDVRVDRDFLAKASDKT